MAKITNLRKPVALDAQTSPQSREEQETPDSNDVVSNIRRIVTGRDQSQQAAYDAGKKLSQTIRQGIQLGQEQQAQKSPQPQQSQQPQTPTLLETAQSYQQQIDAIQAQIDDINAHYFKDEAATQVAALEKQKEALRAQMRSAVESQSSGHGTAMGTVSNPMANQPWKNLDTTPYAVDPADTSLDAKQKDFKAMIDMLGDIDASARSKSPVSQMQNAQFVNEILKKYGDEDLYTSILIEKAESGDQRAIKELDDAGYYDYLEYEKWSKVASDAQNAADFQAKSQYVSTQKPETEKSADDWISTLFKTAVDYTDASDTPWEDILYEVINGNKDAIAYASNAAASGGGDDPMGRLLSRMENDKSEAKQMTEDEVALFNYLYATKGKEAAYEYYEYLDTVGREYEADLQNTAEFAKKHPVAASLMSIGGNMVLSPYATADQAVDYLMGNGVDPYSAPNRLYQETNALQSSVAQNIAESGKWGEFGSRAYQLGMSMLNNVARIVASGGNEALSLTMMATQVMPGTVLEAKNRGLTDDQAMALGAIAAGAEILTEKVSLEKLFDMESLMLSPGKYVLANTATEMSEEGASFLLNLAADIIVAGDESEFRKSIKDYESKGYTHSEAQSRALADQAMELGLSMLGGAISGAIMSGVSASGYNAVLKDYGSWVEENVDLSQENISSFVDAALKADPKSTLYKIATQLKSQMDSGQVISGYEIGRLLQASYLTAGVGMDTNMINFNYLFSNIDPAPSTDTESATPSVTTQTATEAPVSPAVDMADRLMPIQTAVHEYTQTGTVSNRMTSIILSQSDAVSQLQSQTGVVIAGTASQQRAAVKTAIAQLAETQARAEAQTSANVSTGADTSAAEHFRAAAREVMGLEPETAEVQAQPRSLNIDTSAQAGYNTNGRSQAVQSVIDRLNAGGNTAPNISEILAIPEIAEAERANEGTPTFNLSNREKIREYGYRQAMQKGSWNGTDYTGEVNHDRRMDIVIGLPGSGKSSVYTERLSQEHKSRVIDTDDFREYIPEYNGSNASIVHEEASDIRDRVLNTALDNGDNILLSTIGASAKKLEMQIAEYKAEGYQVYLHLNELPNSKSMARAIGRYIGEDGSFGRYVSPKLIAEYGDKPTQTYLYLTGQGGNENGRLEGNLRSGRGQNAGDVAQKSRAPEISANSKRLIAGYDWFNNDVARGEAPKRIQTSELSAGAADSAATVRPNEWSVGAANADFTGKAAYNAILSETNAQPDRASDVRPMELPKTDISGNPVSAVTGNVYGSKITTDELASLMEEPTARGDLSYVKITNDQATQRAVKSIENAGDWERAYSRWSKDVGAGKAGAEMTARGALLLNHYAQEHTQAVQAGDIQTADRAKSNWLSTLGDMQSLGTNTAQGLQAFRLLRELNPPDKIKFMEAAVRNLAEDMGVDIQVDDALYDAYNSATTDEARNAALGDIQQAVADQIPSTLLDKWNALRYTNMLGNLKTNVRNIAGNIGAGAMYRVKDQIAATMEDVLYAATGKKFERTKSHTVSRELLNAAKLDFENVAGIVSDGGKFGTSAGGDQFVQGVMDKRRIFKSDNKILNKVLAPLEKYRQGTNWAMNNKYFGDEAFGRAAYARALAGYVKAHGVTDGDFSKVDSALMNKARAYAVQEAQEATFHDNSALARTMSKLKRDTGVLGEGIMPFTKTPANVLTRAVEFSPLGLIDTTATAIKAAKGTATGVDVVNSLAKSLTGAGLFALGAWLRNMGFLTGGPDSDDDKDNFDQLNGDQDYAIRFTIGGKTYNYTFDWLTPAAMPLFMGGQFWDIMDDGFENITYADLEQVFLSIADPMLQMSMLQGLDDSLNNIKYTDNNLGQFVINACVSYLTQGFGNTFLGQLERSTEKNRMTTYVDKDSQLPAWLQRQLGSLSQKIPGWDFQQTEYINAYGEKEQNISGIAGVIYNTLSPGYISEEKSTALSEEIYRLYDSGVDENVFLDTPSTKISYTDANGVHHKDYNLTQEESTTLKEVYGKTSTSVLSSMIESEDYAALSDEQKAKAFEYVYDYAREVARTQAVDGYIGMASWMDGIEGNEPAAVIQKVVNGDLQSAATALTTAWCNGADSAKAMKDLESNYQTYLSLSGDSQSAVLENTSASVKDYIQFREDGGTNEDYTAIYQPVTLGKSAISSAQEAFKSGSAPSTQTISDMDSAYSQYEQATDAQKAAILEGSQKAEKALFAAKDAGMDSGTFLDLYHQFYSISSTDEKPSVQANNWAYTLQKAVESGTITRSQANVLKSGLTITSGFTQETKAFDSFLEAGVSADQADSLMDLLAGIEPEEGYVNVRPVQKVEQIAAASGMTEKERAAVMKIYLSDNQDEALDRFLDAGYSAEIYSQVYRIYTDANRGKAKTIEALREKFGLSPSAATAVYNLLVGD